MRRGAKARLALIGFGAVFGALLLLLGEGALRLADWPPPHQRWSPFGLVSSRHRLFAEVPQPGGGRLLRSVSSDMGLGDDRREFFVPKAAGAFRIFVIGESSAAGVPYGADWAFAAWLEKRLRANAPGRAWEVVNAAKAGVTSRRVLSIVDEILAYEPDLVIIYAGHNEGFERFHYGHLTGMSPALFRLYEVLTTSHLYSALMRFRAGTETASDEPVDDWRFLLMGASPGGLVKAPLSERDRQYEEAHYRWNVEQMILRLRRAGVQTVLATLSQNFTGWPPAFSAGRDLDIAARSRLREIYAEADRALRRSDHAAAAALYRQAMAIEGSNASVHFRLAHALRAIGHYDEARGFYHRANDLEEYPRNATTGFNESLRDLARRYDLPLADVAAEFERISPHGLVGDNLFVDHIHPNLRAHQVIAELVERVLRARNVGTPPGWGDGYADPDADGLLAANPELRLREALDRIMCCSLFDRPHCVGEELGKIERLRWAHPELARILELPAVRTGLRKAKGARTARADAANVRPVQPSD